MDDKQYTEEVVKNINRKLKTKQAALKFDNTPTTGSVNPVTSEGIKEYVDSHQGKTYTAGENITINSNNVISATDTKYRGGYGINISYDTINIDQYTIATKNDLLNCVTLDTEQTISGYKTFTANKEIRSNTGYVAGSEYNLNTVLENTGLTFKKNYGSSDSSVFKINSRWYTSNDSWETTTYNFPAEKGSFSSAKTIMTLQDMPGYTNTYTNTTVPEIKSTKTWTNKTWRGANNFDGRYVWTDGENIYYSHRTQQYVLDKQTFTWVSKTWEGMNKFEGNYIWTDGTDIYYSCHTGSTATTTLGEYKLNKATSTWSVMEWNSSGVTSVDGRCIWKYEGIYYFSNISGTQTCKLDTNTLTWIEIESNGIRGDYVWYADNKVYYSYQTQQYELTLVDNSLMWVNKVWYGLSSFGGANIWTDGTDIYYSINSNQYVLDKSTSTWSTKSWTSPININASGVWTDGNNIYYNSGDDSYIKNGNEWTYKSWGNLLSTTLLGQLVWTDGENIYLSLDKDHHYILNKSTSTWSIIEKWRTEIQDNSFHPDFFWTDGENVYYSRVSYQYKLNRETGHWVSQTWQGGLLTPAGNSIWTDGTNIYYSSYSGTSSGYNYVLNGNTWTSVAWEGDLRSFNGEYIWTDGENIYYGSTGVLNNHTWIYKYWENYPTGSSGGKTWTDGENIYCGAYVLNRSMSKWTLDSNLQVGNYMGSEIWTDGENVYYSYGSTQKVLTKTKPICSSIKPVLTKKEVFITNN